MGQGIEKPVENGALSASVINLAPTASSVDLSGLSPEQVAELKRQHAAGMIDLSRTANDLKAHNASLAMLLDSLNSEAAKATQSNVSMTATHTQTTPIGRTEIVIGNTDRAASGKLSTSATGVPDRVLWIVGIIATAMIIIAVIASRH